MNELITPKMQEIPNHFCSGCGHGILNRIIAEVVEEFGYENKSIVTLGVGCSCNMNFSWGGDKLQCAHGRASAVVTGVKVARPDILSISYQGDGDAYVIGIAETLNAAYRNANVTVFVVNNNNFAMTGGQMSWTTMPDQITTTSQQGRDTATTGSPMKVPEIVSEFENIGYVARGSVHNVKEIKMLKKYVREALQAQINNEGYSLIEVLAPCPTNWNLNLEQSLKWMEEEVLPYYPTGELKKRKGDR
jgi:2-oxoglutarate ferredoxin oxidoreductase subunit beta